MILEGKNLSLRFNQCDILKKVNIQISSGEFVGLIGPNGAGKTSLLRVLANLQKMNSGEVFLDGQTLAKINRKHLAQTLGYLEQGAPAHWPLQVRRLVELGRLPYLSPWGKLSNNDAYIVDRAMKQAEVQHLTSRVVSTLSGGERLRVLLARMFATEPNIILADEPIASLDPYHQLHTMELLKEHCVQGGSAVIVMHDLNMAAKFCDRLVLVNNGEIAAEGSIENVLTENILSSVYSIKTRLMRYSTSGLTVISQSRIPHHSR